MTNQVDRSFTFRLKVWLGIKLKIEGAPLCRVFNKKMTESYTLHSDGMVIIKPIKGKGTDMIPAAFISSELSVVMSKELERLGLN